MQRKRNQKTEDRTEDGGRTKERKKRKKDSLFLPYILLGELAFSPVGDSGMVASPGSWLTKEVILEEEEEEDGGSPFFVYGMERRSAEAFSAVKRDSIFLLCFFFVSDRILFPRRPLLRLRPAGRRSAAI